MIKSNKLTFYIHTYTFFTVFYDVSFSGIAIFDAMLYYGMIWYTAITMV